LYKASWKNPIIAVAGLNGLRYAFAAHNAFQDAIVDDAESVENLAKVSIALGVMYMISFLIELYGIIGVSQQRLSLVRAYLYLTFLASALVIGAGVLNGVSYFVFAEDLMWECMSLATEGRGYEKSLFRSRPWPGSVFPISKTDAHKQCVYAWIHQSWSQVACVFLFAVVPAVIYYVMVYTYYRQTVDPKHHANLVRNNSTSNLFTSRPTQRSGYARVANDRDDGEGITSGRLHAANPSSARLRAARSQVQANRSVRGVSTTSSNSPNGQTRRKFTPRSLNRPHRPPPLMQSPSPIGLGPNVINADRYSNSNVNGTPGPPAYASIQAGASHGYSYTNRPSRVYAAFAAPVLSDGDGRQYDKFV
jgi:hypothetical protein